MHANNDDIPIAAGGGGGPPGGEPAPAGPAAGGGDGAGPAAPPAAPAPAPQPQNPNPFANYQWRVTYYEEGEEPHVEIMSRFADAWAVAQPWPEEMEDHDWVFLTKADVQGRFTFAAQNPDSPNAEWVIRVCWTEDEEGTYTTIEMF